MQCGQETLEGCLHRACMLAFGFCSRRQTRLSHANGLELWDSQLAHHFLYFPQLAASFLQSLVHNRANRDATELVLQICQHACYCLTMSGNIWRSVLEDVCYESVECNPFGKVDHRNALDLYLVPPLKKSCVHVVDVDSWMLRISLCSQCLMNLVHTEQWDARLIVGSLQYLSICTVVMTWVQQTTHFL
jgi:hypothetical protein